MVPKEKIVSWLSVSIVLGVILISAAQFHSDDSYHRDLEEKEIIKWCTINIHEQRKCKNYAMSIERDKIRMGRKHFSIECVRAFNKEECMSLIDEEKVTLTTLDAGEVFIGGRYHSLVPIMQEVYDGGFKYYYAVAVVKKGTLNDVQSIGDLRGKRGCFAGVGTMAGWTIPVHTLMKEGSMKIIDCNNHVKTAINFFGPSCAVNSLIDKYNPIGDNSDKLCQLCIGKIPGGRCTVADPYAGFEGAFRCLLEVGEIAFLKHSTVEEMTSSNTYSGVSRDSFELLCKDGRRKPLNEYQSCNWGSVPSHAVVTTSASPPEVRRMYQKFLERSIELYSHKNTTRNSDANKYQPNDPNYDRNVYNPGRRYRRQNFGFGQQDKNNQNGQQNNPYGQQSNPYGQQNNPYGQPSDSSSNQNQFGRNDQYNRNTDQGDNRNANQFNPFGSRTSNQFSTTSRYSFDTPNKDSLNRDRDPFYKDPHKINPDQYGHNIDPYDNERTYNREKSYGNHTKEIEDNNQDFDIHNDNFNRTDNATLYEHFGLFESKAVGTNYHNLLFSDATKNLAILTEHDQTYVNYLGRSLDTILEIRDCPVNRMTLCVTSEPELEKCIKMRTALKAQLLKPEMVCHKAHSQINCMQAIRSGNADVTLLDASDVYTAGLNYDLVPFVSEVYNLGEPEYYVVAVAKESDPSTELTYLRGKNTCHTGINTAAGWVYPLAYLISNGWIRPYGCNSIRAAAEYFSKSCVPGALSTEYNTGVPYDNMCDLCHGASYRYCRRDASEDYYGHTGAFRCLVEGGGHVAFVKHTTVIESTGGKRREWWARDALNDDFELLCPDGTRAEVNDYKSCNLGKVKANAVVTRGGYGYNETQINAYINLFLYAQQFYGRKDPDEFSFSMFYSVPPYTDLIFQDAAQQLRVIEPSKRQYAEYLGRDFMRARRITDCNAGAAMIQTSLFALVLSTVFAFLILHN